MEQPSCLRVDHNGDHPKMKILLLTETRYLLDDIHCYVSCYAGAALNRLWCNTHLIAAWQPIFDCETPEYETCVNNYTVTAELTVAFGMREIPVINVM